MFIFFFPMLELCSFYLAVGGHPKGLKLGVVNEELGNFTSCDDLINSLGNEYGSQNIIKEDGISHCKMEGLSCKFLNKIKDEMIIKVSTNIKTFKGCAK